MSAACLASDNFAWRTHCAAKYPVLACCADWWSKSDFVLNELNVQSVVTAPAHDEMIPLSASGTYTVKGFAYSGACNPMRIQSQIQLLCNATFVCPVWHICLYRPHLIKCIGVHVSQWTDDMRVPVAMSVQTGPS